MDRHPPPPLRDPDPSAWDSPWDTLERPGAAATPTPRGHAPARPPEPVPRRLWTLFAGLILWCSCFLALYGGLSLGCEAGWDRRPLAGTNRLTAALAAAWLLHLAAIVGIGLELLRRHRRFLRERGDGSREGGGARGNAGGDGVEAGDGDSGRRRGFLTRLALALTAVSALATFWIGWPVAVLRLPCV